ncbi:MAG: 2-amino-4-hydroxy-6-hydroxymethyldihydropteridine diphosphokinase [Armatimonadetes bacterium]|nr:2-amino-4-hydroxy-6-hydroxymethyldihydropteridine diphosphokinase [Armatimonadota bacterium]
MRAFLGLGSNLGDRAAHLDEAVRRLDALPGVRIVRRSRAVASEPWGVRAQPEFLNTVLEINTTLDPEALLREAKRIEAAMGRQPTYRWGPRLIDIDLLAYDDVRMATPELTLPHPRLLERPFAWQLLGELAPEVLEKIRADAAVSLPGSG